MFHIYFARIIIGVLVKFLQGNDDFGDFDDDFGDFGETNNNSKSNFDFGDFTDSSASPAAPAAMPAQASSNSLLDAVDSPAPPASENAPDRAGRHARGRHVAPRRRREWLDSTPPDLACATLRDQRPIGQ